jgi:ssDNA-binding Zn-finger/Zn-ribbon topoisomerase 1
MSERAIKRVCPACGSDLTLRENKATGVDFYGCERWPDCTHTMPVPADEVMRRLGATPLPGFE